MFPGVHNGPVKVHSNTPVFTSQRAVFGNSFNELTGFPANQLTTDYWFTYYDDVDMSTWLMIGNPDPVNSAHVEVYIGGGTTPIDTSRSCAWAECLAAISHRRWTGAGEEHEWRADLHQPAGGIWQQLQ